MGAKHYFGKFASEQDAVDWIDAHPRNGSDVSRLTVTSAANLIEAFTAPRWCDRSPAFRSELAYARNCPGVRNCALSVRANSLHSAEAAAAVPSVTERYQCQAETQSRGGR
jgi:hypothetical protein